MNSFLRICLTNVFMSGSLYMLMPVLPAALPELLDVSVASAGKVFLISVAGMLIAGPLHSYLVDTYCKKYLLAISFAVMAIVTAGYYFINRLPELFIYPFIHGMAFSVANVSLTTVSIDITASGERDRNNLRFGWCGRSGMILGIALGSLLYINVGYNSVIYTSIAFLGAGLLLVSSIRIPFRAPIGASFFSTDRFILPHNWILLLNMILVSFVPGVFIPLTYQKLCDTLIIPGEAGIPYFVFVAAGFILSAVAMKFRSGKKEIRQPIVIGLVMMAVSVSLFILSEEPVLLLLSALLLGLSLGMASSIFLFVFINLPYHCQRGSANSTYLLAWQVGISSGIALSCHWQVQLPAQSAFQPAMFSAVAALIFFVAATYPYYKRSCLK